MYKYFLRFMSFSKDHVLRLIITIWLLVSRLCNEYSAPPVNSPIFFCIGLVRSSSPYTLNHATRYLVGYLTRMSAGFDIASIHTDFSLDRVRYLNRIAHSNDTDHITDIFFRFIIPEFAPHFLMKRCRCYGILLFYLSQTDYNLS